VGRTTGRAVCAWRDRRDGALPAAAPPAASPQSRPGARVENGELLALAAGHFDVFLTVDAGIEYQQNLGS
jgi:hypothetical protein